MTLYKIVRFYQDPKKKSHTVRGLTGLYLEEAKAHCNDPKTHGPGWFDGYTVDVP